MKKSAIVVLFMFLSLFGVKAQNFSPEQMATRISAEMTDYLQLSEEQHQKVYDLYFQRMSENGGMRRPDPEADKKKSKEEIKAERETRKKMMAENDEKLKAIIGEDKFFVWEMERQRRMESGQFRRQN